MTREEIANALINLSLSLQEIEVHVVDARHELGEIQIAIAQQEQKPHATHKPQRSPA